MGGSTAPLWVAVVLGLASPVTGLGTIWFTNRRESRRLDHEKELKQAEF